jgi:AraC-like DNA-binding protein
MNLTIKNMVCDRCITAVTKVFSDQGIRPIAVSLGEVKLREELLPPSQIATLDHQLMLLGFERVDDQKKQMVEKIKAFLIQQIHHSHDPERHTKWSELIVQNLGGDYGTLSAVFSALESTTIEQFIISQKIEKVKELLLYGQLSIKEIAFQLGYSSVAHLSTQFKKVTKCTPSQFKSQTAQTLPRKALDHI